MVFSYFKLILIYIILIQIFNVIFSNYICIPFKIYENDVNNEADKFENDYILNNIYIQMQVSQPYQNIIAKINSLDYELLMKKVNKLPYDNLNSIFSPESSSSYSIISSKTDYANSNQNSKFVKDNFNLCNNYDVNNRKCVNMQYYNNINFIYFEQNIYDDEGKEIEIEKKYTYIEIGLNIKSHYRSKDGKYSILNELKENKYISNNIWFIHYFKKLNNDNKIGDDEGIIVFGEDPTNFFGNKYNKDDISSCQGINKNYDYSNYWSIVFQELKQKSLKNDNNKDVLIQNDLQGVINHNYNVIAGNKHYMDIIESTFFFQYVTQGVCHKKLANNKFYYYSCNTYSLNLKKIEESFPSLYFKQNELGYTFELTPQDLFVQIEDRIFFLIVFYKNNPTGSFILGKIFLQKYFFSFDNESKKIFFYKDNNKNTFGNMENIQMDLHWYNSNAFIISLIILIFIFCLAGFYVGRRVYKRRRTIANELQEDYDYISDNKKKKEFDMKILN